MAQRLVNFVRSHNEKGMNKPATVSHYTFVMSLLMPRFRLLAKKALSIYPQAEVIADIGTGPGFLAIEVAKLADKKVLAVDLAPNMLEMARKRAAKAGVSVATIEADCGQLPFTDGSIDLIISSNFIHCLPDALPFFKEIKRTLKPGGKAYITAYKRDVNPLIRLFFNAGNWPTQRFSALDGFGPVLDGSFTKEEIESLLAKAGIAGYSLKTGLVALTLIIGS